MLQRCCRLPRSNHVFINIEQHRPSVRKFAKSLANVHVSSFTTSTRSRTRTKPHLWKGLGAAGAFLSPVAEPEDAPRIFDKSLSISRGCTWLTNNPALVDPEQIRTLSPISSDGKRPIQSVTILTTPSLASLTKSEVFTRKLLLALFDSQSSSKAGRDLHVKCVHAIVDALPVPVSLPEQTGNNEPGLRTSEGVAVFLSTVAGEGPTTDSVPPTLANSATTICFASNVTQFPNSITGRDGGAGSEFLLRNIRLPVANTIFVNGKRATLFEDDWLIKWNGSATPSVECRQRQAIWEYRFPPLPCDSEHFVQGGSSRLQSLTAPREVAKSMGNVIAQIEVDGETIPASQELEDAVAAYIKSNPTSTAHGPLRVYALVRPSKAAKTLQNVFRGRERQVPCSDPVLNAVWDGAMLFKVSGGGGGWGKRQGLLSFEPAVSFDTEDGKPATIEFPDFDSNENFVDEFGARGLVAEGSNVEFLVHSARPVKTNDDKNPVQAGVDSSTTVMLGVAADPESQDHLVQKSNNGTRGVQFLPDHFGMISYAGMALGDVVGIPALPESWGSDLRTRFDVPDTSFVMRIPNRYDKKIANTPILTTEGELISFHT